MRRMPFLTAQFVMKVHQARVDLPDIKYQMIKRNFKMTNLMVFDPYEIRVLAHSMGPDNLARCVSENPQPI